MSPKSMGTQPRGPPVAPNIDEIKHSSVFALNLSGSGPLESEASSSIGDIYSTCSICAQQYTVYADADEDPLAFYLCLECRASVASTGQTSDIGLSVCGDLHGGPSTNSNRKAKEGSENAGSPDGIGTNPTSYSRVGYDRRATVEGTSNETIPTFSL
jgi:hypothetical protein